MNTQTQYRVEGWDNHAKQWDVAMVADDERNATFNTEEEALAGIESLRQLGDEWMTAEYRIVAVEPSSVDVMREDAPDWDIRDPATWSISRTVDAYMGTHHTGMTMREYQDIHESANDYTVIFLEDDASDDDCAEEARWWLSILDDIASGRAALATASDETRLKLLDNTDCTSWDEFETRYLWADGVEDKSIKYAKVRDMIAAIEQPAP